MGQGEHGGVAQRETLPGDQVDEEPGDPGQVGIGGDQRTEHQGKVEAGQPGQLGGDHHRGQGGGGDQPEHDPSGPVHQRRLS